MSETEQTPVQRAGVAIQAEIKAHPTFDPKPFGAIGTFPLGATMDELARVAFASVDVEGLAAVLIDHTRTFGMLGRCACGHVVPLGHSFAAHQAEAVTAWLTGGEA